MIFLIVNFNFFFLHGTLTNCSLRQSVAHTLSLNKMNYAYITIIIKWRFNDNV